jgi:uncharacterized protein (DUF736 family)
MSEYETRDNSGAIFKNDRKEQENQPDYKGSARVGGVDYWVSVWLKTSQNGVKFMSTAYTAKDVQAAAAQAPKSDNMTMEELDSDIPF